MQTSDSHHSRALTECTNAAEPRDAMCHWLSWNSGTHDWRGSRGTGLRIRTARCLCRPETTIDVAYAFHTFQCHELGPSAGAAVRQCAAFAELRRQPAQSPCRSEQLPWCASRTDESAIYCITACVTSAPLTPAAVARRDSAQELSGAHCCIPGAVVRRDRQPGTAHCSRCVSRGRSRAGWPSCMHLGLHSKWNSRPCTAVTPPGRGVLAVRQSETGVV